MRRPAVIALLTDFGTEDAYVASVKGTILSISPGARLVDIAHGARDISQAAFLLWSSYQCFPAGTIFVAVVDPGVGTGRAILCMKSRRYIFLAPDNGLLRYIMRE